MVLHQALQSESKQVPPRLYRHLHGTFGCVEVDSEWEKLEVPDGSGLCCLTCSGLTFGDCDPRNFSEHGYKRRYQDKDGVVYMPDDSDVVCFEMREEDEQGTHAAVLTYGEQTGQCLAGGDCRSLCLRLCVGCLSLSVSVFLCVFIFLPPSFPRCLHAIIRLSLHHPPPTRPPHSLLCSVSPCFLVFLSPC